MYMNSGKADGQSLSACITALPPACHYAIPEAYLNLKIKFCSLSCREQSD